MFRDETIITQIGNLEMGEQLPSLSFMGGAAMGQLHVLTEGEHVVGRSQEVSISVLDDAISRQHFRLRVEKSRVVLEDLGSTNGTYVNGVRVTSEHVLKDKDTIQISSQTIIHFAYVTDLEAQRQTQIYRMANYDPVTQARTKHYFLDQLEQEFSHAKRRGQLLSLILFDVDFFKKVNDTYGHPAGDYALKRIAELTRQVVRAEDLFARYGGEEFVVLMRDTREEDAILLADRLRKLVSMTPINFEQHHFKVAISCGVASLAGQNFENAQQMVQRADQYLYFAKQNGRNRVASYRLLAASQ